jgi:hypothetical protein
MGSVESFLPFSPPHLCYTSLSHRFVLLLTRPPHSQMSRRPECDQLRHEHRATKELPPSPSPVSMTSYPTPHHCFLHPKATVVNYLVRWTLPFHFASGESPSLASCPRTPPCLTSLLVMAGIGQRTTGREGGGKSPLFPIRAGEFWPRGRVLFFFFSKWFI